MATDFNRPSSDLHDAQVPEDVARILRYAAQRLSESTADLQSAWQDPQAGTVWLKLARTIEVCAARCERITQAGY